MATDVRLRPATSADLPAIAELHLAELELAEVEAERCPAPEREVDEDERVPAVTGHEQVAHAGVAVGGAQRCLVELLQHCRQRVCRSQQTVPQRGAERAREQAAQAAKAGCPVSKALKAVPITLDVSLA